MAPVHRLRNRFSNDSGIDRTTKRPTPQASAAWRAILEKVREIRLGNGLVAVTLPTPGTGSVVCDLYYAGGSAADPPGKTGLTHFLEHMLFNGTRNVPRGELDRLMLRLAGQHNAETGADFCRFWSHVPRQALDLALALEADRMHGAILDPNDFDRERQVILEEEARYREQPFEELMTGLMAEIYGQHPYAHPAIGSAADLARMTAEDLRQHYARMFRPTNALLVIAGDVTARDALKLAERRFASIASESLAPLPEIPRPGIERFDGRSIELPSSEVVPRGAILWPAPGPFELESRPWGIAASVLGGGRSSRLWQALVEEHQIAAHVSVSLSEERHGGYLMIELELHPGQNPRDAESVIQVEIDRLAREGPTADEMARVAASRSSAGSWARQQTPLLATAIGTWRLFSDLDSLAEAWSRDDFVTPEEVARVAAQLRHDRRVRGWSVPSSELVDSKFASNRSISNERMQVPVPATPQAALAKDFEKLTRRVLVKPTRIGRKSAPRLARSESGATILVEPAPRQGICAVELRWRGGTLEESIPGLASLTARVIEESAQGNGETSLAEVLESLGASIDSGASGYVVQGRAEDAESIVELLLTSIARPVPPASVVRHLIRKVRTELEADSDDPAFLAERMLRTMAMEGVPGANDPRGTLESLATIRHADVKRHALAWHRPANMILGVAGDFRASSMLRRLDRAIDRCFGPNRDTKSGPPAQIEPDRFERPLPPGRFREMRSPGTQTHVVMGHRTIARTHPDWVALQVLEIVLGAGPGLTDLLSRRLREELGLIYGVNLAMCDGAWTNPGYMKLAFSCDPADAGQAQAEAIRILADAAAGRLSDEDCLEARDHLAHSWFMSYESADDRLSSRLDTELEDWDLMLPPRWARQCAELSADELRSAAKRHIRPESLQVVRYGP